MEKYGTITAPGVIRFERLLPGPITKVWAYLTESEKRGKWLASGELEPFEGGKVTLNFHHQDLSPHPDPIPEKYQNMKDGHHFTGTVTKINAPYLLAFTWEDNSEVTFELKEQADRVLLTLTHRNISDRKEVRVSMASGWHNHLDILIANLEGRTPEGFWKSHIALEKIYSERIPTV